MKRREMLKCLLATAGSVAAGFRMPLANAQDYLGKLFVFVQADGGWDPTSFCDPKENARRAGHQPLSQSRRFRRSAAHVEVQRPSAMQYSFVARSSSFFI